MVVNWLQNSYFDAALFKPLLHLWSLGVEIQFYLLVPIVGWMARKMPWSLPITALLSWGLCLSMVSLSPKTAFFWLPFRLWEFLAGFMVAYWFVQTRVSPYQTRLRALAWALLLILPLMPVQGQALDALYGHPGLMATLITLLTALILAMGCPPALEKHWSAGLLEKTGHYSYTLYLVHFPVIVWVAYQPFAGTRLTVTQPALLLWMLLLMAGLSALLFHQIERPCRGQPSLPRWLWGLPVLIGFCGWLGATLQNQWLPEKERLLYQALTTYRL